MALINCPECGKEISDKADACIHCGFPLNRKSTICVVNGVEYDLSFILSNSDKIKSMRTLMELTNSSIIDVKPAVDKIVATREIPKVLYLREREKEVSNQIKCPTCSSINVKRISETAKIAGALTFGIFSTTAKSQFKCENCGYKW